MSRIVKPRKAGNLRGSGKGGDVTAPSYNNMTATVKPQPARDFTQMKLFTWRGTGGWEYSHEPSRDILMQGEVSP